MNIAGTTTKSSIKILILPGIALLIIALLAALPVFGSAYTIILLIPILMYIILTVSWAIFSGSTGYISLAPAAFLGIGMYTAAILGREFPFSAIIAIAGAISFLFAIFIGSITLRLRGIYFTIFTFGLVLLIQQLLLWWEINFTGTRGRFVILIDNNTIYYHMLGIFVALILTYAFIRNSKYGLALRSIGQEEEAAAHTGVNVTLMKVITFGISAIFMGAAGAAIATRMTYIDPYISFNINYSFFPVLMAIFGGMGNIYGLIIGAGVFAYLEELLLTKFPYYYMLIFGIIMVIVIIFLPNGLIGLIQRLRKGGWAKNNAHT